jgi:hypothetical protein
MMETRAFPVQERLKATRQQVVKLKVEMQRFPVLEGEISRLEALQRKNERKIEALISANQVLSSDAREVMEASSSAFSSPVGKNAHYIQSRINSLVDPLKKQIVASAEKIKNLKNTCDTLKREIKKRKADNTDLREETRASRAEIKKLRALVLCYEDEEDSSSSGGSICMDNYEDDMNIIRTILTGISYRQGSNQPAISRGKTYVNDMTHNVGWIQEIINASYIAYCEFIRQLGHDGGSISRWETLCISIIIVDHNNENPRNLHIAPSALSKGKSTAESLETIKYTFSRLKEKYISYFDYCIKMGIDISRY